MLCGHISFAARTRRGGSGRVRAAGCCCSRICWSDYKPVTCCVEINATKTTAAGCGDKSSDASPRRWHRSPHERTGSGRSLSMIVWCDSVGTNVCRAVCWNRRIVSILNANLRNIVIPPHLLPHHIRIVHYQLHSSLHFLLAPPPLPEDGPYFVIIQASQLVPTSRTSATIDGNIASRKSDLSRIERW